MSARGVCRTCLAGERAYGGENMALFAFASWDCAQPENVVPIMVAFFLVSIRHWLQHRRSYSHH
eukprot:2545073-Alexandrium_andersonii.AAC.1